MDPSISAEPLRNNDMESPHIGKLPDYFVCVQNQYLIKKSVGAEEKNPQLEHNQNDSKKYGVNRKRTHDDREDPDVRLCRRVALGEECQFGPKCLYSHDISLYLKDKPPDIGPSCYVYEQYGYCGCGLMCRFGDSHIDKIEGKSVIRSDITADSIKKNNNSVNELSKEVQILLRKKKYPFKSLKQKSQSDPSIKDSKVTAQAESGGPITPDVTVHSDQPIKMSEEPQELLPSAEPSPQPQQPTASAGQKSSREPFNSSPYDKPVKLVDFSNKVYVSPLTTLGNLPFRRVLKDLGADITCGEMALAFNLLQGQGSEWALMRRHQSEDTFGIQIATSNMDQMRRVAQVIEDQTASDFVDLNCGCPIDIMNDRGCGAALLNRPNRLVELVNVMSSELSRSVTVKLRTGWDDKNPNAHKILQSLQLQHAKTGKIAAVMLHGRSRLQRYHKLADWNYILQAAQAQNPSLPMIPVIGNGDILSWPDWHSHRSLLRDGIDHAPEDIGLASCAMIGRGALIKPWLPTEIKEQRNWDISASERIEILRKFVNYGLEHWGSDQQGVNTTRRFLLEWMSFLHRYVPIGLLDTTVQETQRINQRPPDFMGRGDMETILGSGNPNDWIKVSELFLGPPADGFQFQPKHKSNSYARESGIDLDGKLKDPSVYESNNDDDIATG